MIIKRKETPKSQRLTIALQETTLDTLKEYAAYYESSYGSTITQGSLVDELIAAVVAKDGDFRKWRAGQATND